MTNLQARMISCAILMVGATIGILSGDDFVVVFGMVLFVVLLYLFGRDLLRSYKE